VKLTLGTLLRPRHSQFVTAYRKRLREPAELRVRKEIDIKIAIR
jgi:hypothetical protein